MEADLAKLTDEFPGCGCPCCAVAEDWVKERNDEIERLRTRNRELEADMLTLARQHISQ
jgi:hypothetical protein